MSDTSTTDSMREFHARLRRLDRSHARAGQGHVLRVRRDGLIVARPRSRRLFRAAWLWRGGLGVGLGLFLFKAAALAHLGGGDYAARLARLAGDDPAARLAAVILQPDPLSRWLAARLAPVLRPGAAADMKTPRAGGAHGA